MADQAVLYTPGTGANMQAFRNTVATVSVDSLASTLVDQFGVPINTRVDGFLRVQMDPSTLLFDTFETLDTTNTWTVGGTTPPTGAAGVLNFVAGTAANATSHATSKPAFIPGSSAYLLFAGLVSIDAAVVTGNQRFWGLGVITTPTLTVPITNGCIFEIDAATGALFASVYSGGARTQSTSITRPTGGTIQRYSILHRASRVYFEINNIPVANFLFPNPTVAALSIIIGSVNGGTALAAGASLSSTLLGLGDTARNANKLADGLYPWRVATIKPASAAAVAVDTALVVSLSPNNPLPAGVAAIGTVGVTALPALVAGTAAIGTVGVTSLPAIPAGTNAIGTVALGPGAAAVGTVSAPAITKSTQGTTGFTTQNLKDAGRVIFSASTVIAGITAVTVEALLSLIATRDGVAVAAATSFAVTSGKRLRITGMTIGLRSTAAAVVSARVTLRMNPVGAAAAASPILHIASLSSGVAAIEAGKEIAITFPDGLEFSGTHQIGITQVASAISASVYVSIFGFEY